MCIILLYEAWLKDYKDKETNGVESTINIIIWQAYDRPTTQIVSCKSNLQLAYDCRVRHKKCRRIFKHVLKSYDNRRFRHC